MVTSGTQHAIDIAIRVLLEPNDEVWVEEPGYPLTHAQLVLAKVRPSPIPVDPQGIVVDEGIPDRSARPRRLHHPITSISDGRRAIDGPATGIVVLGTGKRRVHHRR